MLVLQVSKILTNDTEAGKPEKACVENKKKNDANVNNWLCPLVMQKKPVKEERDGVEIDSSS